MPEELAKDLNRWLRLVGPSSALSTLGDLVDQAAVFVVNGEREILFWSQGAEALLGFGRDEVLGQHCLKANRCAQCMQGCGIAQHGKVENAPLELFRADGRTVRVRKFARGFFDTDGEFAGGIEVLVPEQAQRPALTTPVRRGPHDATEEFHGLVSRSPKMRQVFEIIRNVAETEATVLVRGESGTGKELVARALHAISHRNKAPFMAVNCAALSPALLESELFGHVRGAFTGAVRDRAGLFQRANGGTVFFDEVAELSMDLQAKLLRVLQERSFIPVGGERLVEVDVRVISATHRALREEVKSGRFREDLMYRVRVVPIFLPALRERREDISALLWHFIQQHNDQGPRRIETIAPDAMRVLLDHHWPGNVREVQNVVEYAFAVGRDLELGIQELPPEFRELAEPGARRPRTPKPSAGEEAEQIRQALLDAQGRIDQAARSLGMSRATFWRKRKRYGVDD